VKKQVDNIMYDRLFSIYLTPKALDDIKVKKHDFGRVVNETTKKQKRREVMNNSVEYRSNQHLPDVAQGRNTVLESSDT
jgi:hypothetical protein